MEYKGIVEAWEEYKSQIREPFADMEKVFMAGFRAGFEQDSEIHCTGNNGNGCFLDSCGHNCGCVGIKSPQKIKKEVKRIEIINHTQTDKEVGRIFTYYGDVELSFQDSGKTLKCII
jgi:hypothetical protein